MFPGYEKSFFCYVDFVPSWEKGQVWVEPKPRGFWSQPHLSGPLGAGTVLHEAEPLFFPTGGLARNSACFSRCIISRGLTVWRRQEVGCRVPAHTWDLRSVVNLRGWSKAPRRRFRDAASQGALGGREHSLDVHVPLLEGNQAWPACPTPATSPGSPEPFIITDSSFFGFRRPGVGGPLRKCWKM